MGTVLDKTSLQGYQIYFILIIEQLLNIPLILLIVQGMILALPKVIVWTLFTICVR